MPALTSVAPMKEQAMGLSVRSWTSHTASAIASMSVIDWGVRITST